MTRSRLARARPRHPCALTSPGIGGDLAAWGEGDAGEVGGDDDVEVRRGGRGFLEMAVEVGVALREVGQHHASGAALGADAGRLGRGEVADLLGEGALVVEEG